MIVIILYMIISFLLDGLISNYTCINIVNPSYLRTIFSVVALIISFNYFDNNSKYLKILVVVGILFDIVYTNTFMLNIILFYLIYLIIKYLNVYIPNNIFTINIKCLLGIFIYHLLSYIILLLVHYMNYSFSLLLIILTRSIIMTIIYTSISYYIVGKIYYKKYDKRIK